MATTAYLTRLFTYSLRRGCKVHRHYCNQRKFSLLTCPATSLACQFRKRHSGTGRGGVRVLCLAVSIAPPPPKISPRRPSTDLERVASGPTVCGGEGGGSIVFMRRGFHFPSSTTFVLVLVLSATLWSAPHPESRLPSHRPPGPDEGTAANHRARRDLPVDSEICGLYLLPSYVSVNNVLLFYAYAVGKYER